MVTEQQWQALSSFYGGSGQGDDGSLAMQLPRVCEGKEGVSGRREGEGRMKGRGGQDDDGSLAMQLPQVGGEKRMG